jgi:tetraacyldisaccharide 4'-kinase
LTPLSTIYGAVVQTKNSLYDRGVLKPHRLSAPVISVGNLSVGGSGKTPFVIMLGELLKQRRIPFDVLSRGYGRKTRGVLAVDPNGSPRDFGDEPLLIAQRLGCPVIVGESRYEAGLFAEKKFGPQLHVLDDGFQHRSLARDFDVVLITPEDVQDQLLPSGHLREQLSSLRRADAVVLAGDIQPCDLTLPRHVWRIKRGVDISGAPERPVVFCGIAKPRKFVEQIRAAGVHPAAEKFYRDHHSYTSSDVGELRTLRDRYDASGFITTEKDAINLGPLLSELGQVAVARVIVELDPADALDTILRVIAERRPQA